MRVLIQRVSRAAVTVHGDIVGEIAEGLLLFVGVGTDDGMKDAEYLAPKIANLRIFPDTEGRMNRSVLDVGGSVLVVSQFTLYADARRGRRPSFIGAAQPDQAIPILDHFVGQLDALGVLVAQGRFGAMMDVELVNDGPVTIWLDTLELLG